MALTSCRGWTPGPGCGPLETRRRVPGLPVLVLSQHVEPIYAREPLADGTGGVGYLLKDRVFDSGQFAEPCGALPAKARRWTPR